VKFLVAAVIAALGLGMSPAAAAAPVSGPDQIVTVAVTDARATTGVLQAWERRGDAFVRVHRPVRVYVGREGVGRASESRARTPRGVFALSSAFGRLRNPGTALPYTRVGMSHWWVSDVLSRHYNTMRVCRPGASCGFRQTNSEQLGAIDAYAHAIVIDYNTDPVAPGRGSAFFLHVSEGEPTAGCVSMSKSDLVRLMRWLTPDRDPVISINVGDAAYSVLD
jgi:L,D-peptidoglycan transpeptidase YkuD (ErfK/YbiS/YcfS/YnhG family)